MKNLVIFLVSLLVSFSGFAQSMEKLYYEHTPDIGGDAVIKSSNVKVADDEISKTFVVETSEFGAYYLDAWIMAPSTEEGYVEYKVAVNGVLSGLTFKPTTDDWHSLAMTDAKKSVASVNLKKGIYIVQISMGSNIKSRTINI